RRFLNGRLAGEKLLLPGIARLGEFPVRIKVAVVSVAAAEHGFLVRSPPHPRAVGIALLVAAGGRWLVHGRGRANQNPFHLGIFVQGSHPVPTWKRRSFNPRVSVVVAGVHETAEGQLLHVVQAMDSLRWRVW